MSLIMVRLQKDNKPENACLLRTCHTPKHAWKGDFCHLCEEHCTLGHFKWKENEDLLKRFLDGLQEISFIKSTNSVTDEETEYPPAYEDQEAIIALHAEMDREDLKEFLVKFRAEK